MPYLNMSCPTNPAIWTGLTPICLTEEYCPVGATLKKINGVNKCVVETTTTPTLQFSNLCFVKSTNAAYGLGTRCYKPNWTTAEVNTSIDFDITNQEWRVYTNTAFRNLYWENNSPSNTIKGPVNRLGVWLDSDCNGTKNGLVYGTQVIIPYCYNNTGAERTIYVGIAGDNTFELTFNGSIIVSEKEMTDGNNFRIFHIFPVIIKTGDNLFNFKFISDGMDTDSAIFAIYDNTATEILNATKDSDLNIITSSFSLTTGPRNIYSCAVGWDYDCLNNVCKKSVISDPSTRNTGFAHYTKRQRNTDLLIEDNIEGVGVGTYVPDYQDLTLCPI